MTETGRVREVSGTSVTIQQDTSALCFGCMSQECKAKGGLVTVENSAGLTLTAGQRVETEVPAASLFTQFLTVLFPPLIAFAVIYLITGLIFPGLGEPARAACGVPALFGAGFIRYRLRRNSPVRLPRIVRVVEGREQGG
jgi:positive regulator of sigma E activity